MKTINDYQTHRRSISDYERILKSRQEREAQKLADKEEQQRIAKANMLTASQKQINTLCHGIQVRYTAMVNAGKNMEESQKMLQEKLKEEKLFQETSEEIYPIKEIDENQDRRMGLLRVAYHGLPILDSIFAFFALSPIITSKIAHSSSFLAGFAEPVGVVASLLIGYGLSLLSRWAVSSMSENDSPRTRMFKTLATGGAMMCLPLIYVLGEFYFNNGQSWPYSLCFAFVSLIIQLLIVFGYKQQNEALYYLKQKKQNETNITKKKATANEIGKEIDGLHNKIQNIVSSFDQDYAEFTREFRELAAARDEHIVRFGEDVKLYLNQLVIYVGNLFCFRHPIIPLHLASDGAVAVMPLLEFPDVKGVHNIYTISDFVHINNMLERTMNEVNLAETNRAIEENQSKSIDTPKPSDDVSDVSNKGNNWPEDLW